MPASLFSSTSACLLIMLQPCNGGSPARDTLMKISPCNSEVHSALLFRAGLSPFRLLSEPSSGAYSSSSASLLPELYTKWQCCQCLPMKERQKGVSSVHELTWVSRGDLPSTRTFGQNSDGVRTPSPSEAYFYLEFVWKAAPK